LIAFDSGWYRETARSTCFLSWGSRLQLSINARARELPYTSIFSLARRGVSCDGSPRSASEILNRLSQVSFNAVLLKELRGDLPKQGDATARARPPQGCAAMQQIADWLEKLGMSEYALRFAENRIDFSVLADLTDQDLKDLGIVLGLAAKCCVRSVTSAAPVWCRRQAYLDRAISHRREAAPGGRRALSTNKLVRPSGRERLPTEELVPLAEKLLKVPRQLIRTALELELKDGTVVADRVGETPCGLLGGLWKRPSPFRRCPKGTPISLRSWSARWWSGFGRCGGTRCTMW
jgi:hypothetical protein